MDHYTAKKHACKLCPYIVTRLGRDDTVIACIGISVDARTKEAGLHSFLAGLFLIFNVVINIGCCAGVGRDRRFTQEGIDMLHQSRDRRL